MALAVAYFFSGNFERAAAVAVDARIGSFRHAMLVASTVRLGKLNETEAEIGATWCSRRFVPRVARSRRSLCYDLSRALSAIWSL